MPRRRLSVTAVIIVVFAAMCLMMPAAAQLPAEILTYLGEFPPRIPGVSALPVPWQGAGIMDCGNPWTGVTCVNGNTSVRIDISNLGLTGVGMPDYTGPAVIEYVNVSRNAIEGSVSQIDFFETIDASYNLFTTLVQRVSPTPVQPPAVRYIDVSHNPGTGGHFFFTFSGSPRFRTIGLTLLAVNAGLSGSISGGTFRGLYEIEDVNFTRIDFSNNTLSGTDAGYNIYLPFKGFFVQNNLITDLFEGGESGIGIFRGGPDAVFDASGNRLVAAHPFYIYDTVARVDLSNNLITTPFYWESSVPDATTVDISNNSIPSIDLVSGTIRLYAQNNSATTFTIGSADVRALRLDANELTACPAYDPVVPLEECDLRYNFIQGSCTGVTAPECLIEPQFALPPVLPPVAPPVLPPVDPPVLPPMLPPVNPPVLPPADPPVLPPVNPPVLPPADPPVLPPVNPPVLPPADPPVLPPAAAPVVPPPAGSPAQVPVAAAPKASAPAGTPDTTPAFQVELKTTLAASAFGIAAVFTIAIAAASAAAFSGGGGAAAAAASGASAASLEAGGGGGSAVFFGAAGAGRSRRARAL